MLAYERLGIARWGGKQKTGNARKTVGAFVKSLCVLKVLFGSLYCHPDTEANSVYNYFL